jgi:hypothetical protein
MVTKVKKLRTNEQALETYRWAGEFMQAVKAYLHPDA